MKEEKKKVNSGLDYKNGKYRPNIFIDRNRQEVIEARFKSLGYNTANEYFNALIEFDLENNVCPEKEQRKKI